MNSIERLAELRSMLREKFPAAHAPRPAEATPDTEFTGVPSLDRLRLGRGHVVEIVSSPGASALLLHEMLAAAARDGRRLGLIDGRDSFDPQSVPSGALPALLWCRCRDTSQALRAADILVRDGNLPLLALDLQLNATRELLRVPRPFWSRLSLQAEKSGTLLLTFTPQPVVTAATARHEAFLHQVDEHFTASRPELLATLRLRSARATERPQHAAPVVPFRMAG